MPFSRHETPMTEIQEPSFNIFGRFIVTTKLNDGSVHLDAAQVVGKECFKLWLCDTDCVAQ